jgi:hypothetical protein
VERKPYQFKFTDFFPIIGIRNKIKRELDGMPSEISDKDREIYYNECAKKDFILAAYTLSWSVGTFTGLAHLLFKN